MYLPILDALYFLCRAHDTIQYLQSFALNRILKLGKAKVCRTSRYIRQKIPTADKQNFQQRVLPKKICFEYCRSQNAF